MGQKVNSLGLRLGINKKWDSKWYINHVYCDLLHQDLKIRNFLIRCIEKEGIIFRKCIIRHSSDKTFIFLHTYGENSEQLKKKMPIIESFLVKFIGHEVVLNHLNLITLDSAYKKITNKISSELVSFKSKKYFVTGLEVMNIVTLTGSANLLAIFISTELENNFRHSQFLDFIKKSIPSFLSVRSNIKGIRVQVCGRLNGADRSKTDWFREGQVPLHSLKDKVDYSTASAFTVYGVCGIKVWVCSN